MPTSAQLPDFCLQTRADVGIRPYEVGDDFFFRSTLPHRSLQNRHFDSMDSKTESYSRKGRS